MTVNAGADTAEDRLILPPAGLAGCVFAALLRDTRGRALAGRDLYNHFPASPLYSVSWVFEGALHRVIAGKIAADPMPRITVAGPQGAPVVSWSPGPVRALTLGIYPEAWAVLSGQAPGAMLDESGALADVLPDGTLGAAFAALADPAHLATLETQLLALWRAGRGAGGGWTSLGDWLRATTLRAMMSGAGRSLRQSQRRLRALTGQNRRRLEQFARFEALRAAATADAPLAEVALEAGFSDQSHMGRTVRQMSGLSPAALNRAIAEEEAFWAYRLLGQDI